MKKKIMIYILLLSLFILATIYIREKNQSEKLIDKKDRETLKLVIPNEYNSKKIEISNEVIKKVETDINEYNKYEDGKVSVGMSSVAPIMINGEEKMAFIGAVINKDEHVYSNMEYNFTVKRNDKSKIVVVGESLYFLQNEYGDLDENEAFLLILPFPEGLPEDFYTEPGGIELYSFVGSIISQEIEEGNKINR